MSPNRDESRTQGGDGELPGYTTRSTGQLAEHSFTLEDGKSRTWIWLSVRSRANSSRQLPLYFEGDMIGGTVSVDFSLTSGVKGVSLTLYGGVTIVGQEVLPFLEITKELWNTKSSGSSAKLKGKLSWPFSIALPTEVEVAERPKEIPKTYCLPPNFSERASTGYIDYKLIVTVRRGALKVNHTLVTNFAYVPVSRAAPPSPLRQLAYLDGSQIVGLDGDPDGWKQLSPVNITGTLFNTISVSIGCKVSIASPPSYAAGSPIPILVTFQSNDNQALGILSLPTSVRFHLYRERLIGTQAFKEDAAGRSNKAFREFVSAASFWPHHDGAPEEGKRTLQGELEIRKGTKPSFTFPRFSLRYVVLLLPFEAPGFSQEGQQSALLTEGVTIHTANAPGVIPRSYAPPGYEHAQEGNYNNAIGYLENGNQRFYNHGHGLG